MEKSSFFNSINGDRRYKAEDYANYFASFIGNGVFPNPSTNLQVLNNNNMTITLKSGRAWINGYFYANTDDLILTLDPADGVLNRIDRIVLRLDYLNRENKCYVKKGTFASTPTVPSLQRDADMYELGIADIKVNKGVIKITQADITDLRQNSNYCGIVHGTVEQIDVTTLFNQYSRALELKEQGFEQEFQSWFSNIKGQLSGDLAGNLAVQINEVKTSLEDKQTQIINLDKDYKEFKDTKGQADGLASLGSDGKIPSGQLPNTKDIDNGRYQADFSGFDMGTTLVNVTVNNKVANLYNFIELSQPSYNNSSNVATLLSSSYGYGERLYSSITSAMDEIEYVEVYLNNQAGTNGNYIVSIYNETTSTLLGQKSISSNLVSSGFIRFVFDMPISNIKGNTIQIRVSSSNFSTTQILVGKTDNSNVISGAELISTTNSWSSITTSTSSDLAFKIGYRIKTTSGVVLKSYYPTDLKTWGNVKWEQNTPVNTSIKTHVIQSTANNMGYAQSGSTANTIKLGNGSSSIDDYYKGQLIYISNGTGNGQIRKITGYIGSTKVATLDSNWNTIPDTTSYYFMHKLLIENISGITDLSSLNTVVNPNISIVWCLNRVSITDITPTITNPSLTMESLNSGNLKSVMGSYIGDGSTNRKITIGITPKLLIIFGSSGSSITLNNNDTGWGHYYSSNSGNLIITTNDIKIIAKIVDGGFNISYHSSNTYSYSCNEYNASYSYMAIY